LIIILQLEEHPPFHHSITLKYIGLILLVCGIVTAVWVLIHEIPVENWMVDCLTLPELKAKIAEEEN
jgi:hypothetical protein